MRRLKELCHELSKRRVFKMDSATQVMAFRDAIDIIRANPAGTHEYSALLTSILE